MAILFILLALVVIFLSIKISYYSDYLSKTTKTGGLLIGGIFLAAITSLPELVTCLSSIMLDNPYLSFGDILGSNVYNIFFICVFDLFLVKKKMFNKTSRKYIFMYFILLINYFFIFNSSVGNINISFFNIGLASYIVFILYIIYIFIISKIKIEEKISEKSKKINNIKLKFILCAIGMILASVLLTIVVNKIAISNPKFSGSFIGATLLGIVTSLPELVTFLSLIKLNNFNIALSDIIGSNLFNLVILVVGDIFIKGKTIYFYTDMEGFLLIKLAFVTTLISFFQNLRTKSKSIITYLVPSIIVICLYLYFLFT